MEMAKDGNRLGPDDWADAALTALATGGLAAVAVEPLAKRLNTTKGSFYWHFKNRDALIAATMRRWQDIGTEQIIDAAQAEPDPVRRLYRLLEEVMGHSATGRVELSLLASAEHPAIAPALRDIGARRIAYVGELLRDIGIPADEARRRAVIAVSIYHGFNQLTHAAADALPGTEAQRRALVGSAVAGLLAGYADERVELSGESRRCCRPWAAARVAVASRASVRASGKQRACRYRGKPRPCFLPRQAAAMFPTAASCDRASTAASCGTCSAVPPPRPCRAASGCWWLPRRPPPGPASARRPTWPARPRRPCRRPRRSATPRRRC